MSGHVTRIIFFLTLLASFIAAAHQAPGQTWTRCHPKTHPPFRRDTAMAFDEANGCLVRFGGSSLTTFHTNETWVWDGVDWSQRFPKNRPLARFGHAMAYDAARQRVVLFGGYDSVVSFTNDTWIWNGSNWTQLSPSVTPPPMYLHAMVYDSARRRLVVFGGQGLSGTAWIYLNQTWEFDGKHWIQYTPPVSPSARIYHAMAFDAARGRTVLFGGYGVGGELNDTWEWDGTNWKQCTPAKSPAVRLHQGMAWHGGRKRAVLFGGLDRWYQFPQTARDDTWEWDGAAWVEQEPAVSPSARAGHVMAYDAAHRSVLLVGCTSLITTLTDTWKWGNPPVVGSGSGGIGTTVNLVLTAENDRGVAYLGASSFGNGPLVLGEGRWVDLSPDGLFVISAANLAPAVFSGFRGVLDGGGKAKAAIHIPKVTALIGQRIHTAFVSLDAQAPEGIRSISETHTFTITQ